eukprot:CAMPEP_0201926830 /NCGR_PEP_ID=MMETSP0903-20130614/17090_1 /ASSEMBLY_ACC=CAM_ASM_000552 /TAXON_ID=420261 /ORGANISM="Thalassiosira antarctica, Strain CCMP982" /LENGTH=70 /DNA_ID=CAMNT_0048464821 /DNA_START=62 /DNA_END=274 /DNA_ORIENTATION=-
MSAKFCPVYGRTFGPVLNELGSACVLPCANPNLLLFFPRMKSTSSTGGAVSANAAAASVYTFLVGGATFL